MGVFWKDLRDRCGDKVLLDICRLHGGKRPPIPTVDVIQSILDKEHAILEDYARPDVVSQSEILDKYEIGSVELEKIIKRNPDGTAPP